jgi:HAD superfamily hydrolase (TIGR01509 family)
MRTLPADKAVIFDMDGVISDTQQLHSESEVETLARFGIKRSAPELSLQYSGVADREMFAEILQFHGAPPSLLDEVVEMKWRLFQEKIAQGIPLIPNIERLLADTRLDGYRLAVASGAPRHFIERVISHPLLRESFEAVVSSEEVPRGKPAPDVFLEAARRIRVSPSRCVVIEDGYGGMLGAQKAGMRCIGIVKDATAEWPADRLVSSVGEISLELIASLLNSACG